MTMTGPVSKAVMLLAFMGLLVACEKESKFADPTWSDVVAGTRGLGNAQAMQGRVLFYEQQRGLREEIHLIKVAVSKGKLDHLLVQLNLDRELKQCARREFPKYSKAPAWALPSDLGAVPCTTGKIKHGTEAWLVNAHVTEPGPDGMQLVFLSLVDSLYE